MKSNLLITLEGTYSYRLYINLFLFKIAKPRVTEKFSVTRKVKPDFGDVVIPINDLIAVHLKMRDAALIAKVYYRGVPVAEYPVEVRELVNQFSVTLPKLSHRGTTAEGKITFEYVD